MQKCLPLAPVCFGAVLTAWNISFITGDATVERESARPGGCCGDGQRVSEARGFLVVVIYFPPLGHKRYSPHLSSVHICFFLMLEDKLP